MQKITSLKCEAIFFWLENSFLWYNKHMHYKLEKIIRRAGAILLLCIFLSIAATALTEKGAQSLPSATRQDISAVLGKDILTPEDYQLIWRQTGLGAEIVNTLRSETDGNQKILQEQRRFLSAPPYDCRILSGLSRAEGLINRSDFYPMYDLQPGDVVLTKSTHTLFYRHGHSALCLDADTLLEATAIGSPTEKTAAENWGSYPSGIHLRISEEAAAEIGTNREELGKAVAAYAEENLGNDTYSLLAGTPGKGIDSGETQCAYLIWAAYRPFGIDVSSRNFPVTPHSLLQSGKFEVIRCWGIDTGHIDW